MRDPLDEVRVDALPAHGLIGKNWNIGVMAVSPGAKLSGPFLGIGLLQVGNRNGLCVLVRNIQEPLLQGQSTRLRLCFECGFFFGGRFSVTVMIAPLRHIG